MKNSTHIAATIKPRHGPSVKVRPLREGDVDALAEFFAGLGPETRGLYGPHAFDRETAEEICASIDRRRGVRFVAMLQGHEPRMVGYMILTREIWEDDAKRYGSRLDSERCASFAPVIAEGYRDLGLGTRMAEHVIDAAAAMGLSQIILMGGVQARNGRAVHFYEKLGFERVGQFYTGRDDSILNYDMILESRSPLQDRQNGEQDRC